MTRWRTLLLCLLPLLVALLVSFALAQEWLPNSVLIGHYSIDTIALVTRSGCLLSVCALLGWGLWAWHQQRLLAAQMLVRQQTTAKHKQFIQRLDHEIKNPLTIMQLGLANLLHGQPLAANDQQSLERLQKQVERLRQLVMDLRSLTELEDRPIEHDLVDLPVVLRNAIETVLVDSPKRQIDSTLQSVPWPVGKVIGDTDLLAIALTNLLNNALKFTVETGHVQVQITDNGQQVAIEIADNGIGIPSAELPYVFDELYRAGNAGRINGSGMGLALVDRIIKLHKGSVAIRSREGHGTAVTITLPLANAGSG